MKICFMCDLHLPFDKNAMQYDALEWACCDILKSRADCVVVVGDYTANGELFPLDWFNEKMKSLNAPVVMIPGNSDMRTPENVEAFDKTASPVVNKIGDCTIIAINDSRGKFDDSVLDVIENADKNTIVITHHPYYQIFSEKGNGLVKWREKHPEVRMFYGHLHESKRVNNDISLQALDPDKAIGENPCITYYDTETDSLCKSYYYCPVPQDFYEYIGISCFNPIQDINYAIEKGIKYIELRPAAAKFCKEERKALINAIEKWRSVGGKGLSLHAPGVSYVDGKVGDRDEWEKFIQLANDTKCDRITLHVPNVSLYTATKENALEPISDFVKEMLSFIHEGCVIGVENMHMKKSEQADLNRGFGYIPCECISYMKLLRGKCKQNIGINLDVGHSRNNSPFSQRYTLSSWYSQVGEYAVGYHIHQVTKGDNGFNNHMPITDVYGCLISYASFFRAWSKGQLKKAPVILEIRGLDGEYKPSVELFEKYDLQTDKNA